MSFPSAADLNASHDHFSILTNNSHEAKPWYETYDQTWLLQLPPARSSSLFIVLYSKALLTVTLTWQETISPRTGSTKTLSWMRSTQSQLQRSPWESELREKRQGRIAVKFAKLYNVLREILLIMEEFNPFVGTEVLTLTVGNHCETDTLVVKCQEAGWKM